MTVFRPRDHRGLLLDPDASESAGSTKGRQFTLRQMMKAVLIVAVILAIAVQRPDLLIVPFLPVFLLLAACLYGLSRLPFRIRLTIELATVFVLLNLSACTWRPPFYINQADRTEEVARLCSMMAGKAGDERSRDLFRREAAEYGRRAAVLRVQGMWYGLLRSATKEDPVPITDRELILELGLLECRDRHELLAKEMGVPEIRRRP